MKILKITLLLLVIIFCKTKNKTNSTTLIDFCNSLNETINPSKLDCVTVNQYCCYANYSIFQYNFRICFYNLYEDINESNDFFKYKIGSIANSPFIKYDIFCYSQNNLYSLLILSLIIGLFI